VAAVRDGEWISDTRESYDTVAESYAGLLRDALASAPYQRGILGTFAELVRDAGGGPVVDVGCGTGRLTGYLHGLGLDVSGIDLSPGMIAMAEREHPGLRFRAGSMTELPLADDSVNGLFAWWSLIHVPDEAIPGVFAHFRRALRAGGPLMVGFNLGEGHRLKTEGYGGHPMKVAVYRRTSEQVTQWLHEAGFTIDMDLRLDPDDPRPGAVIFAR
jgi:ubiquinone/menaquinone biosynthesis C-methylase UbiE